MINELTLINHLDNLMITHFIAIIHIDDRYKWDVWEKRYLYNKEVNI